RKVNIRSSFADTSHAKSPPADRQAGSLAPPGSLAQTRKLQIMDAAVTDVAAKLALVVVASAAPASAVTVADHDAALDLVSVALAVNARHLGDVGAAIAARAALGCADALVNRGAAVAIAAIIIAIAVARIVVAGAIIIAIIVRGQDRREPAEHHGSGDDLACAAAVAVITVARHYRCGAHQGAGGGHTNCGLGQRRFDHLSHGSVSFTVRQRELAAC